MGRTVGIDGAQSAVLKATRGITASSGFATTELRILMQEVVMLTLAEWGNGLCLTLYVDDLTIETTGTIVEAAAKGAAAVDFICKILEDYAHVYKGGVAMKKEGAKHDKR